MGNCITAIEFSYIPQSDGQHIARPRLARRPKVKKGSHEEGVWARVNLNRLGGYELSNQNENPTFRLAKADIRRCVEYAKILGDDKAKSYYSHQLRN